MSIRLSRDEAWAELASAHTGILTTLRVDGVPITLPVWFVVRDERIFVSGPARTKKFARLRRDPRCSFLVESGERWDELRAVHVTGRARELTDAEELEQVAGLFDEKYRGFRTARAVMPEATRAHYSSAASTIEIVPDERILSWDNARIGRIDAGPGT